MDEGSGQQQKAKFELRVAMQLRDGGETESAAALITSPSPSVSPLQVNHRSRFNFISKHGRSHEAGGLPQPLMD